MSDKKTKADELDHFWDIGKLLPQKKNKTIFHPRPQKITPKTVSTFSVNENRSQPISQPIPKKESVSTPQRDEEATTSVFATYHNVTPTIPCVTVVNWKSTYNYYEFFCKQAAALYNKKGEPCEEVHFFSYVAQYSQLNRRQLEWYLWWRECVRNGIYLKVDISYIYLLVFEIINLGNSIDTKKSLDLLISIWSHYQNDYPQLVSSLGDWIADYSLIYNLPIAFPDNRISREMIASVTFKGPFLSFDFSDDSLAAKFLLSFCNAYNYRKSKFYTDENKEYYDLHIPSAITYLVKKFGAKKFLTSQQKKHLSLVSFTGALCSYKTRKHIEVDYLPLCDSPELKRLIGETIKYAENKLRSILGIRSRLTVTLKEQALLACVDEYFSQTFSLQATPILPEYEKLYEAKPVDFSIEQALNIEKQSWDITEKLVDAFEEEEKPSSEICLEKPLPTVSPEPEFSFQGPETERFFAQISSHVAFFRLVLREDIAGQKKYAVEKKLLIESIVDDINDVAVEIWGDILLEEYQDGYRVIEDYRSYFE